MYGPYVKAIYLLIWKYLQRAMNQLGISLGTESPVSQSPVVIFYVVSGYLASIGSGGNYFELLYLNFYHQWAC